MENSIKMKKKLKICFIDMVQYRQKRFPEEWFTPYSTFYGYDFDKEIQSRVSEHFGWSTDLEKLINAHSIELNLHIITYNFLQKKGVVQKFQSRHGREYDDHYSYLQGMNVLAIESAFQEELIQSLKALKRLFSKKTVKIPVDLPRIVLLAPIQIHSENWLEFMQKNIENLSVCADIRDFIKDFNFTDFIDFALSHGYKYSLSDYISIFDKCLKIE